MENLAEGGIQFNPKLRRNSAVLYGLIFPSASWAAARAGSSWSSASRVRIATAGRAGAPIVPRTRAEHSRTEGDSSRKQQTNTGTTVPGFKLSCSKTLRAADRTSAAGSLSEPNSTLENHVISGVDSAELCNGERACARRVVLREAQPRLSDHPLRAVEAQEDFGCRFALSSSLVREQIHQHRQRRCSDPRQAGRRRSPHAAIPISESVNQRRNCSARPRSNRPERIGGSVADLHVPVPQGLDQGRHGILADAAQRRCCLPAHPSLRVAQSANQCRTPLRASGPMIPSDLAAAIRTTVALGGLT